MSLFVSREKAAEFSLLDLLSPEGREGILFVSQSTWMLAYSLVSFYGYWRSRYYSVDAGGNLVSLTDEEWGQVTDIVDLAVEELSMTGYTQLVAVMAGLTSVLESFEACCAAAAASASQLLQSEPNDGIVSVGGDNDQFEDQLSYLNAKCSAANAIYDTLIAISVQLDGADIEQESSVGGVIPWLSYRLQAGIAGWAISRVESFVVGLATLLLGSVAIDWGDIGTALDDKHSELVLALYGASTVVAAKANFLSILATATPTLSSTELEAVQNLLPYDLLNQLFSPRSDVSVYSSSDPVDCGAGATVWSFPSDGMGWTFRDDSTGAGYSASGVWSSSAEGWTITMIGTGSVSKQSKGTIYLSGLSISVDVGQSIQFDFGPTLDGINSSKWIRAIYDDLSEYDAFVSGGASAGTITLDVTVAGVIETIECSVSRKWTSAFNTSRDIQEVRVL